jgi:hypothetical protein
MQLAIFGLIGVVVGAFLTAILALARELWIQSRKDAKERECLAIQVSCQLERYVAGCVGVVADDGLYQGQTNEHGEREEQATPPKFEPELLKVEWKSLEVGMMYEILDFPLRAEEAKSYIDSVAEHAFPPDHWEWFEERQYQYAKLGLHAASLAARLRDSAGIPARPATTGPWDPLAFMAERLAKIEIKR